MAHLDLAGVSADGRRLLLVGRQGEEFTLEISPALRAALRGETTRIGQLEIQMTSTLRPREIQTRIRAGETPEEVAAAAQTTVEAIMPFVGPVLGEREHVAERAQKSSLRRPTGDAGSGTRLLRDAVSTHLSTQQAKADDISWDAFRRDDGRWEIAGTFETAHRSGTARFTYDVPGNYVTTDNDDARWLVGDLVDEMTEAQQLDDLQQARQRRLAAISSDELPLGDDALDLVGGEAAPPTHDDPLRDTSADVAPDPAAAPDETAPVEAPHHRRPVAKKRGRASVPSWDEIMFGGGDQ
ncbi:septation protein SepH [Nocardioides bizhenqiangii]|uniref:Septation protein SepH n=1 Tax=Nocardioides bizhenqiangii TaxID=3095076 RepID=A0ABZ0ZMF5_9ACTN|nr:septation protein SepH [Nocardioides sp. HM61]WQQ24919.1 septation protein SepH [Nocardioides sp. HM61]